MEIPERREVIHPGRGPLGLAEELSRAEDRSDLGHERRLHGFARRRARAVPSLEYKPQIYAQTRRSPDVTKLGGHIDAR